ncbi:MAG: BamA/TamA family outer membrane protein [Candidatus Krumholzibacteriia bacterium]
MSTRRVVPGVSLLLVAGLLLAALPAAAQRYGKNKVQTEDLHWEVLTTPHFDLHYHDGAQELAVRAALIAERAYAEYADRLDRDLPFRVPFILYSSHADFAQTNISPWLIGEGTGGFSEPFRNRVVLPYNGSHEDFVHVIRHELVHVFMFDMAFGARTSDLGRNTFFNIPLWFAEGVAEWLSSGWDAQADMVIRDATLNDYLQPLEYVGGYMVYKQGQAAMRLLSERYGPDKLNEFWREVGRLRSVERALMLVYGLGMDDFNRLYARELRARYWPHYNDLEQLEDIARPLTGGDRDEANYHGRPALNPDGDLVACFTDRDGLIDLYLLSALDGREIRRLGRSMRESRFESFHSFRSGLDWSPDGREIVLVAKSGNRETLHTLDAATGRETRRWDLGLDVAANPAWSPDGRLVALVGTDHGRTDLYLVELVAGALDTLGLTPNGALPGGARLARLTDDAGDEGAPRWSPDGRRLVFAFNPRAEVEFTCEVLPDGRRRLLEAASEAGPDTSRVAPPPAVDLLVLASGERHRLYEPEARRRDPVWIDAHTLAVVDGQDGIDNLALVSLDSAGTRVAGDRRLTNILGGVQNLTYAPGADRLVFSAFHAAGYDLYAADGFAALWSRRVPGGEDPRPVVVEPPTLVTRQAPPDTVRIDPDRIGLIEPYHPHFRVDASRAGAGGAVYWTQAGGLGFANLLTLTDDLGDRRLDILLNFYGAVDNSDLAFTYTYLKRRIDLAAGAFLFNNYYNSVITSVGELLTDDTLFREKNYGVFGRASYPFSTFRRLDLDLQLLNSDRTEFDFDDEGFLLPVAKRRNQLLQPTLGLVHDNALFGLHGPMAGSRWSVSVARGLSLSRSSLDRWTVIGDLRKYWLPSRRTSLAAHLTYAQSTGDDPRAFVIGGPWTLRGYRYHDFQTLPNLAGTRLALAQFEYRIPFVDYLIFGWPGRWGLAGIGGAVFFDAGAAWYDDIRWDDVHSDYGLGLRANVAGLPLKFDWAWRTDGGSMFQFSIGPEF